MTKHHYSQLKWVFGFFFLIILIYLFIYLFSYQGHFYFVYDFVVGFLFRSSDLSQILT
jgi:hypothetical protein